MSTSLKVSPIKPHDALAFLAANHKALLAMFRDYEQSKAGADQKEKGKTALRVCHRLSIHEATKEEMFYPAATVALGDKGASSVADAQASVGALRGLMVDIEHTPAKEPNFDVAMKALGEMARKQFEKESELFTKLRHSAFDVAGVGEKLAARQLQLSTEPARQADIRQAKRVLGG